MVLHRAVNGIMQTSKKEVYFSSFQIVVLFDKRLCKSCVKRIHLVTDDGLYHRKVFYKVKMFLLILYE